MSELPYSPPANRNREPILTVLREHLAGRQRVLEIGAGTGQHAVFFATEMPWLVWQATDFGDYYPGLAARVAAEGPKNCPPPLELDVRDRSWPVTSCDVVYSANTLHIMSWPEVEEMFRGICEVLAPGGCVCVYGPFRYGGQFTTPSNAAFDASLRARDPASGIRDFEAVCDLAARAGLSLTADHAMPANNQLIIWERELT